MMWNVQRSYQKNTVLFPYTHFCGSCANEWVKTDKQKFRTKIVGMPHLGI